MPKKILGLPAHSVTATLTTFIAVAVVLLVSTMLLSVAYAQPAPRPPSNLKGEDTPLDAGGSIQLSWTVSPDDTPGGLVDKYILFRSTKLAGPYEELPYIITPGVTSYTDAGLTDEKGVIQVNPPKNNINYYYQLVAVDKGGVKSEPTTIVQPVMAERQWFHPGRINMLVASLVLSLFILIFIWQASLGKELYIRPIAGLEAVQEAIGRATEMGKPVLFIPGIMDMDDIQTIAAITILGRVARMIAEYDADILVPTSRSLVMTVSSEVVREAYLDAGRPDAFKPDNIRYLTDDQFGYVAGVDGIMLRERPAANFYLGTFYAESLILAETGASVGAIQIAGTAMASQLPFFVAACDYTLIGEELFAASAYLSREPKQLGSLIGQDWGKVIFLIFIIIGSIIAIFNQLNPDLISIKSWFEMQ
jgi:hypothetical protein